MGELVDPAKGPKSADDLLIDSQVPSTEECIALVKSHPSALQFKNSLRYIQGGTNMTLDRMIDRFDVVLAQIYAQGMQKGIDIAKALNDQISAERQAAAMGKVAGQPQPPVTGLKKP